MTSACPSSQIRNIETTPCPSSQICDLHRLCSWHPTYFDRNRTSTVLRPHFDCGRPNARTAHTPQAPQATRPSHAGRTSSAFRRTSAPPTPSLRSPPTSSRRSTPAFGAYGTCMSTKPRASSPRRLRRRASAGSARACTSALRLPYLNRGPSPAPRRAFSAPRGDRSHPRNFAATTQTQNAFSALGASSTRLANGVR